MNWKKLRHLYDDFKLNKPFGLHGLHRNISGLHGFNIQEESATDMAHMYIYIYISGTSHKWREKT